MEKVRGRDRIDRVTLSLFAFTNVWLRTEEDRWKAISEVEKKFPKKVKKKRPIFTEDGSEAGMEEYYDYLFSDEVGAAPNIKLIEMAQKWKKRRM